MQWRPDASYILDVIEFENLIAQAKDLTDNPVTQRAALEAAVALYHGDLLPSGYDDWIIPERERLRQAFSEALESLVWLAEEQRDYSAAIHYANHLLRHDPLHEPAYRLLMRCHALNGDRAGALRVYHTCVTVLQRELGVEPGQEVQAAYTRLLDMEIPTALGTHAAPPLPTSERLVGRQQEWQTLRTAWQSIAQRQAHFCLIRGEAGIGKTRLAEELLAWAERQGIATARTRSYAAAGGLAYTPVIEWLRSEALQTALAALDNIWLTEVARLLPELLFERPALPHPEPQDHSGRNRWQRQKLFDALGRSFVADRRPKLLIIDDLQWCDPDTMEWLRYLLHFVQQVATRPHRLVQLLVVGTARMEEIDGAHPLSALLLDLHSTGQVTEIKLGPLSSAETVELAAQTTNRALDEATADQLYAQTEGNPLFIVEAVRKGMRDQGEAAGELSNRLPSLPPKVQTVIQQRLAQLSPAARDLACLAAVIGRSFTFGLLQAASEREESAVISSLDELWRRRIVREQGIHTYDFSHDHIREVAYAAISPVQRPLLHRRVARALEQVYAGDLDPVSAQLAAHYEQAGASMQALHYYQRAAEVAGARYDYAQKIEFINASLRLLQTQPAQSETIHRKLSLLLAKAYSLAVIEGFGGREMVVVCEAIEKLLPQVQDDKLTFQACTRLSGFFSMSGKMDLGYQYGDRLLELAHWIDEPTYVVSAYQACGTLNLQLGHFVLGKKYMELAEVLYQEVVVVNGQRAFSDSGGIGILANLAYTLWLLGYPERALDKAVESVRLAERLGDPQSISIALFFVTLVTQYRRELEPTAEATEHIHALDSQYGIPLSHAGTLVSRGWSLAQQGHLADGIAQMRAGIEQMKAMNHTMFQTHRLAWLAEAQLQAELLEEAAITLAEGFAMAESSGQRSNDAELQRLHGELRLAQGRFADAEASFHQAIEIARSQEAKSFELRAVTSLCRLWQRQGRQAEARLLLAAVYGWFSEGFDTADLQAAQALLAELS